MKILFRNFFFSLPLILILMLMSIVRNVFLFMLIKKKRKEDMFFLCYTCQEASFHYFTHTKTGIQSEKKLNRIKPGRKLRIAYRY
jgi:hypothetical protein